MCVFFAQELCFVFGGKYDCLVEVSCIWNRQFWNFLLADFGQKFRFILKKRRLGLQVIFLLFSFYDSRKKCPFEWRIFPFSLMPTSAAIIGEGYQTTVAIYSLPILMRPLAGVFAACTCFSRFSQNWEGQLLWVFSIVYRRLKVFQWTKNHFQISSRKDVHIDQYW